MLTALGRDVAASSGNMERYRPFVFKGIVAERAGVRGYRTASDIDVLVHPEAFSAYAKELERRGWVARIEDDSVGSPLHSTSFYHPRWPIDIDLHHSYPGLEAPANEWFRALYSHRRDAVLANSPVHSLSPLALFHLQVLHALREPSRPANRAELRFLYEKAELPDWESWRELATATGSLGAIAPFVRRAYGISVRSFPPPSEQWKLLTSEPPPGTFRLLRIRNAPCRDVPRLVWKGIWPSTEELVAGDLSLGPRGTLFLFRARVARLLRGTRELARAYSAAHQWGSAATDAWPSPSSPPRNQMSQQRILHVIECDPEGGVALALRSLIARVPEAEHHIATVHDLGQFETAHQHRLGGGLRQRVARLRALEKELKPTLVHAHSSWAGGYSRLGALEAPVLYQPHCFYFDNPGGSRLKRAVYKQAERLLVRRTRGIITLTEHEARLARSIGFKPQQIWRVPNVSVLQERVGVDAPGSAVPPVPGPVLVMIGRAAAQKDPGFFADAVRLLHVSHPEVHAVWIGDGGERHLLETAGVQVTGWLPPEDVRTVLASADVYLHSASYEGFPLSVLDAAELAVPMLVRDLSCFDETVLSPRVSTPAEAAEAVSRLLESSSERQASAERSRKLAEEHSTQAQRTALLSAYNWALGTTDF